MEEKRTREMKRYKWEIESKQNRKYRNYKNWVSDQDVLIDEEMRLITRI